MNHASIIRNPRTGMNIRLDRPMHFKTNGADRSEPGKTFEKVNLRSGSAELIPSGNATGVPLDFFPGQLATTCSQIH